jgi:hypothetical protein
VLASYEKEQKKLYTKEAPFKPASGYRELVGVCYPHLQEENHKKV